MGTRLRGRRRRLSITRSGVIRIGLVLVGSLLLGWLTVGVSGANLLRNTRPDLALSLLPFDARAHARNADLAILQPRPSAADQARARAEASLALLRDPTVAAAWRSLAMTSRDAETSARIFHYTAGLTHRDLPTQLFLIEESVRHNDIPKALQHYDEALRTTPASYNLLFPVLVQATSSSEITSELGRMLHTQPPWRIAFFEQLAAATPNPQNAVQLIKASIPNATRPERDLFAAIISRWVNERNFSPAAEVYMALSPPASRGELVRNGGFQAPNSLPPFQWKLEEGQDVGAEIGDVGQANASQALHLYASGGTSGVAARQLIMLPPGSYRVAAFAGTMPGAPAGTLFWRVICGNAEPRTLVEADLPALTDRAAVNALVQVPNAGCPAQWIELGIRGRSGPGRSEGWMDDIRVARVSA